MEGQRPAGGSSSEGMEEIPARQDPLKKCSLDGSTPASAGNGCFDCNICLDFAVEPVVTLCGHLYCWPCIYQWLQQAEDTSQQPCPVCKASISEHTLVPLYGRGHGAIQKPQQTLEIPRRPSVRREAVELRSSSSTSDMRRRQQRYHLHQHGHYHHPYHSIHGGDPMQPLGTTPWGSRAIGSTAAGSLGGLAVAMLPWAFRNQEAAGLYHPSSLYHAAGNGGSPRLRRQELELERTLHQFWAFLFFCAMLCLLLF